MSKPYPTPGKRTFREQIINKSQIFTMTTPAINFTHFKIDLDTIPIFEGREVQINSFIKTVDSIVERYANFSELCPTIRAGIFNKFRGKAAEILCPRDDLCTWIDVRTAILQHFSDSRSIEQILIEFNNIRLERNETIIQFGNKIRLCLSKLISKLNLSDLSNKELRQELYTANALDRFLVSIPYHISSQVRLRKPENLDQAITFATDEVNFMNRSNSLSQRPVQKPVTQTHPPKPNFQHNTHNNPNFFNQPQRFNHQPNQFNQNFQHSRPPFFQNTRPNNPANQFKPNTQFRSTSQQIRQPFRPPYRPPLQPFKPSLPPPEPMSCQTTLACEENVNSNNYYDQFYYNSENDYGYNYEQEEETAHENPNEYQDEEDQENPEVNFQQTTSSNPIT